MSDLSIATYTASGAASVQYAVPFPFIDRSHVRVLTTYDKGTGVFGTELAAGSGFLWINDSTIEIPALAAATVFSIVRQTPSDLPLVDWVAGGGALTAEELSTATLQVLYLAQERFDQAAATSAQATAAEGVADTAITDAAAAVVTAQEALAVAESAAAAAIDGVIPDSSITAIKLATGAVTEPKIANGAVTAAKTSAGVQASLEKADSALQASDTVTSDTDVTTDRLLKNLAGPAQAFRRGNLLGTVSQSGGVPTGAAMESGSNSNGTYIRFANGFQICWISGVTLSQTSSERLGYTWTYPAAFSGEFPFITTTFNATSSNFVDCAREDMGPCMLLSHGGTSASVGTAKTGGGAYAATAQALFVRIMAVGRWF